MKKLSFVLLSCLSFSALAVDFSCEVESSTAGRSKKAFFNSLGPELSIQTTTVELGEEMLQYEHLITKSYLSATYRLKRECLAPCTCVERDGRSGYGLEASCQGVIVSLYMDYERNDGYYYETDLATGHERSENFKNCY